jgi:hypothetical protein
LRKPLTLGVCWERVGAPTDFPGKVITMIDPAIYEEAADLLAARGWRSMMREQRSSPVHRLCISDAVHIVARLAQSTHSSPDIFDVAVKPYLDRLAVSLGALNHAEIWALNDSKSDEEGPAWARDILRGLAAELRGEQK